MAITSQPQTWLEREHNNKPLKWTSPQELSDKIEAYFQKCDETIVKRKYDSKGNELEAQTKPYTITGLALALDTSRETINEYSHGTLLRFQNASSEEERNCALAYVDLIKKAKRRCENWLEDSALTGLAQPIFSMFVLKNNYGWKDTNELELKHSGTILVEPVSYALKAETREVIEAEQS